MGRFCLPLFGCGWCYRRTYGLFFGGSVIQNIDCWDRTSGSGMWFGLPHNRMV